MKKRILNWLITMAVALIMIIGSGVSVFGIEAEGDLFWSWKVPVEDDGWNGYGVSSPTAPTTGNHIYVVSYDKLYKIQYTSGKVEGVAKLDGNIKYNRIAPAVGDGKVFIPLTDSKLAVVDASTMEVIKTITYAEGETGYQSISPAVYDSDSKDIYLGSWGGTKAGTYVKIDVDNDYKVTKIADGKGFYYAGAAVNDNYVVFGSDAPNDDLDGTSTLYVWNKKEPDPNKALISTEIANAGSIRATVVEYNNAYYFTTKGGKFYKAEIAEDGKSITTQKIADLGASSVCTPLIFEGKAYVGYQLTSGFDSKGGVKVIDLAEGKVVETNEEVPANVISLFRVGSPLNESEGKGNVYATYNGMPGGIYDVTNKSSYYIPDQNMQQYCMSTIAQKQKRLYYTNDSGYLMALEVKGTTEKCTINTSVGEGGVVSPSISKVSKGSKETLYITPDEGYKLASIKVMGEEQSTVGLYGFKGTTEFTTDKIYNDTTIEVGFKKVGAPIEADIEMTIQQENVFDMAHEKITVSSDVAEVYGYEDKVVLDKVSALDALVAAHIKRYGPDKTVIQDKLVMKSDGSMPSTMMGKTASEITTTSYSMTGFTVNEKMAWQTEEDMAVVNTAFLESGDRVDFFWYMTGERFDVGFGDIFTGFFEGEDKMFIKKVKEGETFELVLKGFSPMESMFASMSSPSDEMKTDVPYNWGAASYNTGEAKLVLLEKVNGTYTKSLPLNDAAGNPIVTDSNGVAKLKLKPGKYYISAEKEYAENGLLVRNLMPWLEVTVECDPHDFENGVCKDCGELNDKDVSAGDDGVIDDNEQIGGGDTGAFEPADDGKVIADEEGDASDEVEKAEKATDTGDDFNLLLFAAISVLALAAAMITVCRKRRI